MWSGLPTTRHSGPPALPPCRLPGERPLTQGLQALGGRPARLWSTSSPTPRPHLQFGNPGPSWSSPRRRSRQSPPPTSGPLLTRKRPGKPAPPPRPRSQLSGGWGTGRTLTPRPCPEKPLLAASEPGLGPAAPTSAPCAGRGLRSREGSPPSHAWWAAAEGRPRRLLGPVPGQQTRGALG